MYGRVDLGQAETTTSAIGDANRPDIRGTAVGDRWSGPNRHPDADSVRISSSLYR